MTTANEPVGSAAMAPEAVLAISPFSAVLGRGSGAAPADRAVWATSPP